MTDDEATKEKYIQTQHGKNEHESTHKITYLITIHAISSDSCYFFFFFFGSWLLCLAMPVWIGSLFSNIICFFLGCTFLPYWNWNGFVEGNCKIFSVWWCTWSFIFWYSKEEIQVSIGKRSRSLLFFLNVCKNRH